MAEPERWLWAGKGAYVDGDATGTAVITGAASGIGLAVARRVGAGGRKVVLVDVDAASLREAERSLGELGIRAFGRVTDVAVRGEVEELARWVTDALGEVSLLVNSAGVFTPSPFFGTSPAEWEFVVGVNLWGVVHTMEVFLPPMVARDEGRVVNVTSIGGILSSAHATSYIAAKHAVVGLSESVFRELERVGSRVGITVLCPGAVPTNILRSIRHWPERLGPAPGIAEQDYPQLDGMQSPDEVAEALLRDIAADRFWSVPERDRYASAIRSWCEEVVRGCNPGKASMDWRSR